MNIVSSNYRNWDEFTTNKTVGVITTLLSEQFLEKSYNIIALTKENYIEEIELYDIDTVFFDNELFEKDHPWYRANRGHIINYLKNEGINICVILNTTHEMSKVFKQQFVIEINPALSNYTNVEKVIQSPLLIDSDKYNPVNSEKTIDIIYFSAGKLKASPETKLYNKTFKPEMYVIQDAKLTRHSLKKLFSFLKKAKVLYICESKNIDDITLKYIEAIAYLNTANVIYDYTFKTENAYGYNSQSDKNNVSKLRILLNNEIYNLKQSLFNQRQVLTHHTFILKQNIHDVISGQINKIYKPKISVITSTNRNQNLDFYLNQMSNQKQVDIEINMVTHGFEIDLEKQSAYKEKYDYPIKFISADSSESLGTCLNMAIDSSQFETIAKIDDDDYYLDYYLYDQWLAMQYSDSSVVGKSDGYYYFEKDNLVARRNVGKYFKYDYFIMGATIMANGDLMRKLKFSDLPRAVDTDFLRRTNELGGKIYIGHPFEMCVFRDADIEGHTWKVNDLAMLKSSEIVSFGDPTSYVGLTQNI